MNFKYKRLLRKKKKKPFGTYIFSESKSVNWVRKNEYYSLWNYKLVKKKNIKENLTF